MKKAYIAGLFLTLLFLAGCGKTTTVQGTVVEKSYQPSSTGVGFNGKRTTIVVTPEKYTLVVTTELKSGAVEVNANFYVQVKVGDRVTVDVNDVWGILRVRP